jgi:hypothetical protein
MAGTLPLALAQQFDIDGSPLAGAQLFFFQVGTVSVLQNSFQDFGLTIPNANPLIADQFGRIPNFYLADGQIHVRLTDASGNLIFDIPSMQVVGPSSGSGGGGSSVDPTTIFATGDVKWQPTSATLTGWVVMNGLTIGNATSGASQRANADTQALFTFLWNADTGGTHFPVVGGKGATAGADFSASKQITLPDLRGRSPFGLDNMGSADAGRLLASNVTSGNGDGITTPAATGGEANHTLTLAEAPQGQITFNDAQHQHAVGTNNLTIVQGGGLPTTIQQPVGEPGGTEQFATTVAATGASVSDHAGGGAHNNMPPFMLGTWFQKL